MLEDGCIAEWPQRGPIDSGRLFNDAGERNDDDDATQAVPQGMVQGECQGCKRRYALGSQPLLLG